MAALYFFRRSRPCSARVYLVPVFLVFPIAFALNRLGQHYAIDPADPAKWGSILKPSRFWEFWYLSSAYHLEHHYFPGVPFYNLRRLHFALRPVLRRDRLEDRRPTAGSSAPGSSRTRRPTPTGTSRDR